MFGEYIKQKRIANRLSLREFCRKLDEDASNWSKIERGKLAPPQDPTKLQKIAEILGIDRESQDWNTLCDSASISAGKIPAYVLKNPEVVKSLPIFFRTIGSVKPTEEDILKREQKQQRVHEANQFLQAIASCGRRFFWSKKFDRVSRFELAENGRLYFYDKYTGVHLPLSHMKSDRWQIKFSEGGTLKALVKYLAHYIRTGKPITNQYVLGPWEEWMCRGDLWGYAEDMEKVRQSALKIGIYKPPS